MAEPALKVAGDQPESSPTSRREKFVRLAENRTINAIKAIRIIGKLGNRSAYDYNDADVRKIVKALTDEIEALKTRMKSTKPSNDVDFKL